MNPFSALNYSKANLNELNRHFANSDLCKPALISDLNSYWSDLRLEVTNACLHLVPKTNCSQRKYPRYFTPCIRHKLNCIRTLRRRIRRNATLHSISRLENMELELLTLTQTARANYEAHLTATFLEIPKNFLGILKIWTSLTIPYQTSSFINLPQFTIQSSKQTSSTDCSIPLSPPVLMFCLQSDVSQPPIPS